MSIAVVGGAGYIGAHVVRLLSEAGREVLVIDDLSTSSAQRVPTAKLCVLNIAAATARTEMAKQFRDHQVSAVIHFAARKQVGESVEKPLWYYHENVGGMTNLLQAMHDAEVQQIIFSSSAAVYGEPDVEMVPEDTPTQPINPYGQSKLWGEQMLAACQRAWNLQYVALRYFNVAGAGWPQLGDPAIMNLIPMVFERLEAGKQPLIFGDDYPTPDGTCIRDYVHVLDLAHAHIAALAGLEAGGATGAFNVGNGQGTSVAEVIAEVARVTGQQLTPAVVMRRLGDPARLVADVSRIETQLGFRATRQLGDMVASAWQAWRAARS